MMRQMMRQHRRTVLACALAVGAAAVLAGARPAAAQDKPLDKLKVTITQRGQWDTAVTELGMRAGIFKRYGLDIETLYTQGGPESHQAVISGSMDIACGGGIENAIGAFGRGAPLRIIGSETSGSPDTYWFVPAGSPIRSLNDAKGKTISYSQNGSSSHSALLAILDQYKVEAKPVATGGHPATLTMAMSGQIDIGRGAAPFGLELVEQGKIRVIARGTEIKERANQTVRICAANLQTLARGDIVARFMQGYRDTLDYMYADPAALAAYETISKVPAHLMAKYRDEYFPKAVLWPDAVLGLDMTIADTVKNKFLAQPLTVEQVKDLIRIPAPLKATRG